MPAEANTLIDMVNTLGVNVVTLLAAFYYIQWITKSHRDERTKADEMHKEERLAWMQKDSDSDAALRSIMADSNKILGDLKSVLTEQTTLLRQIVLDQKK
jgi:hypothetical protein